MAEPAVRMTWRARTCEVLDVEDVVVWGGAAVGLLIERCQRALQQAAPQRRAACLLQPRHLRRVVNKDDVTPSLTLRKSLDSSGGPQANLREQGQAFRRVCAPRRHYRHLR